MIRKGTQEIFVKAYKGMTMEESNLILRNVSDTAPNIPFDKSRTHLNFEIAESGQIVPVDTSQSIPERIKNILRKENVEDPNRGLAIPRYRTVANFFIGGTASIMRAISFGKQNVFDMDNANNCGIIRMGGIEHWALDVYNFICERYNEKCIAAFIVHLDVNNPYVNCILIPIITLPNGKKKISWKKKFIGEKDSIFAYKKKMIELHDELAKVNLKYGLLRGESFHTK